jgi:hypothetical protein
MAIDPRGPIPPQLTAPGNSPSAHGRGRGILGQAIDRLRMGPPPGLANAPGLAGALPPGFGGAPPGLAGLPMGQGTPPAAMPTIPPPGLPMAPPQVPPVTAAPGRPMPQRTFPPGMTVNGRRSPVY